LGERLEQEVSKLERRTNDDVAVIELPRHQAAAITPMKQALPTTLGDTVELGGQAAEVRERHGGDRRMVVENVHPAQHDLAR
ncbi:MAG TPA: hypothetical protein VHV50_04175, partial [Actinomycetota bacterium]|nr:hypothetical protein [Actinomycetota bacterium]